MDHESTLRGIDPVDYLQDDELLGDIVRRVGPRSIEPAPEFFERFVRSIIRQQVSMQAARAIENNLVSTVDLAPKSIIEADIAELREAGLSEQKAHTVVSVAEQFTTGTWSRDSFSELDDASVIDELTTVKGVGVWTAKMQLMFSLGRIDVFPVEDLGIRRGMQEITGDNSISRTDMTSVARRWAPVRSLASVYLWELSD